MRKFTSFLLLALITLLIGLMFTGCGTRKVVNEETKIVTKQKDTVSEASIKQSTIEIKKQVEEKTNEKETQKEISAEVKDGETLQVDEFDKDGKLKGTTIFKGSGKAKVSEVEKNTASDKTTKEDLNQEMTQEDSKSSSSEAEQTIDANSKKTERTSEADLYIGIGFLLLVFFLIWRLKRKEDQQTM